MTSFVEWVFKRKWFRHNVDIAITTIIGGESFHVGTDGICWKRNENV